MTRSERLLALLDLLRQSRRPITADAISERLQISVRTVYRDIRSLQSQGAHIEGEAGIGYQMQPGFWLPPLMFSEQEIEALVLGMRWLKRNTDPELANSASSSMAKILDALPAEVVDQVHHNTLLVGSRQNTDPQASHELRQAIRTESVIEFDYQDAQGALTTRRVWPFAMGYFSEATVLVAWCETRNANRHFRVDRMQNLIITAERYPTSKRLLAKQWRVEEGITESWPI